MNESENTIQEEIDDFIEKCGPLELDAERVHAQRFKDAEKKKRRRRRVDRSSGGNPNEAKHEV